MASDRPAHPGPRRDFARWRRDADGAAAVEFAILVPVMIALLFGMSEVTLGLNMDRKLTNLSRAVVDLASRVSSVSTSDVANIFAASTAMMQPYDTTKLVTVLSSIKVTQSGTTYTGAVDWSCAKGTGAVARGTGTVYTVPNGFKTANSYFLVAEATLPYRPFLGYTMTGTITLKQVTPWPVRNVAQVTGPGTCPT